LALIKQLLQSHLVSKQVQHVLLRLLAAAGADAVEYIACTGINRVLLYTHHVDKPGCATPAAAAAAALH
jgi:hypothetical protein